MDKIINVVQKSDLNLSDFRLDHTTKKIRVNFPNSKDVPENFRFSAGSLYYDVGSKVNSVSLMSLLKLFQVSTTNVGTPINLSGKGTASSPLKVTVSLKPTDNLLINENNKLVVPKSEVSKIVKTEVDKIKGVEFATEAEIDAGVVKDKAIAPSEYFKEIRIKGSVLGVGDNAVGNGLSYGSPLPNDIIAIGKNIYPTQLNSHSNVIIGNYAGFNMEASEDDHTPGLFKVPSENNARKMVAIGTNAAFRAMGSHMTAIGNYSSRHSAGNYHTTLGQSSGETAYGEKVIYLGGSAGRGIYGDHNVIIGESAGRHIPVLKEFTANFDNNTITVPNHGFNLGLEVLVEFYESSEIEGYTGTQWTQGIFRVLSTSELQLKGVLPSWGPDLLNLADRVNMVELKKTSNNIIIGSSVGIRKGESNYTEIGKSTTENVYLHGKIHASEIITDSDQRLKNKLELVTTRPDGIEVWKYELIRTGQVMIGWIAQQVEQVLRDAGYDNDIIRKVIPTRRDIDWVATRDAYNKANKLEVSDLSEISTDEIESYIVYADDMRGINKDLVRDLL